MDRELRIATRFRVVFEYRGQRITAESEDLSRRGMFVRTYATVPTSALLDVHISIPMYESIELRARVAHVLGRSEAKALGRYPGLGLEFVAQDSASRSRLLGYLDSLIEETTPPPQDLLHTARLLIADPQTPLLVRLTNALEGFAGFDVQTVTNGADALVSALENKPDAVLVASRMDFMNGVEFLKKIRAHDRLVDVPVILMTEGESDLARLEAFRVGATDVISKPFTEEELTIRLRRVTLPKKREERGATLTGTLGDISLGSLLSLLDYERKSGVLLVLRGEELGRVAVSQGRVIRVDGPAADLEPLECIMRLLDWKDGNFEFTTGEVSGDDLLQLNTQQLLLEHARLSDESDL